MRYDVSAADEPIATTSSPSDLTRPPASIDPSPNPLRGWEDALGPAILGAFLWVAFFDQIPQETLGKVSLAWPVAGAALGGLLAALLLYRVPAWWSFETRKSFAEIAQATFGTVGARCIPLALVGLIQPAWIVVSVGYGLTLTLRALVLWNLLDPSHLTHVSLGSLRVPPVVVMLTGAFWIFILGIAGRFLPRVIEALMRVYTPTVAVLLGGTVLLAFRGLGENSPGTDVTAGLGLMVLLITVQMVFAFSTTVGLAAADWGAALRAPRDVRLGGWVGVLFTPWIVSTLAILTVAGAGPLDVESSDSLSYLSAVERLLGARWAGLLFLGYGLAALAPACFAGTAFVTRMNQAIPRISQTAWMWIGMVASWLLSLTGWFDRMLDVFTFIGAVLAPVAGAITADALRSRAGWPLSRSGWNVPGFLAWTAGASVGLLPVVGRLAGNVALTRIQPASVYAYLFAFLVYFLAAEGKLESTTAEPQTPTESSL